MSNKQMEFVFDRAERSDQPVINIEPLKSIEPEMRVVDSLAKLPDSPLFLFKAQIPAGGLLDDELGHRWLECLNEFRIKYKFDPIHGYVWDADPSRRVFFHVPQWVNR